RPASAGGERRLGRARRNLLAVHVPTETGAAGQGTGRALVADPVRRAEATFRAVDVLDAGGRGRHAHAATHRRTHLAGQAVALAGAQIAALVEIAVAVGPAGARRRRRALSRGGDRAAGHGRVATRRIGLAVAAADRVPDLDARVGPRRAGAGGVGSAAHRLRGVGAVLVGGAGRRRAHGEATTRGAGCVAAVDDGDAVGLAELALSRGRIVEPAGGQHGERQDRER